MACSASYYTHQILTEFRPRATNEQFNHDLNDCEKIRANILVTQKAAAVQILIELLVSNQEMQFYEQRQVQCHICCFIHELFIEEPQLCKLIHFQGLCKEPVQARPFWDLQLGIYSCTFKWPKTCYHSRKSLFFFQNLTTQILR